MSFRSLASLRVAAFFAVSLLLTACEGDRPELLSGVETIEVPAANPGAQTNQNIADPTLVIPDTFPVSEGDELTLVFEEEFERSDINPEVWFFATGDGTEKGLPGGWGNNELQYYLPDNAQIVNGVLEITARRENVGGLNYSSARINTEDRFAFKYGRIEASMKLPSGQGLWPAFWMLSQDSDYECDADGRACVWAATGEIDIVEAINLDGTNGNEIFATLHYGGEFPANQESSVTYTPSVDVTESFNTYAIEWDANEIRWYFNGLLYAVQNSWNSAALNGGPSAPFDQNFHVLLNLAVGGNFPGDPNGTTPFPATMYVDWVRVYSGEDPDGGAATEPNVSAPTPTEDPAGVISLFSDAYDDIAGIDYNPFWGQGTVVTIAQIAGNEMLRYGNLDYQGTDFAGNPQDVSDKGYLHLDFWTADSTALNVYLISPGPVETSYELTGDIAPNSWVSVDIPLSEFAGVDLTNLIQLKFDGNGTIFLDNLYFGGEAPLPATGGEVPAASIIAADGSTPDLVAGVDFTGFEAFGTQGTNDYAFAGDSSYGNVVAVTPGVGYGGGSLGQFGIVGFTPGFAAAYDALLFKVKGLADNTVVVKLEEPFPGASVAVTVDLAAPPAGVTVTDLGDGWSQVVISIANFGDVSTFSQVVIESVPGSQAEGSAFYVTDVGFNSAGATGGEVPAASIIAADGSTPDLVAGVDFTGFEAFGTQGTNDYAFAGDSSYGNVVAVTPGVGYGGGSLGQFGIVGFTPGFAAAYDALLFKVKGLADNTVVVKLEEPFPGLSVAVTVDLAAPPAGVTVTDLGDGWSQVVISIANFGDVSTFSQVVIESVPGSQAEGSAFYVTDVGFNSAGATGGEVPGASIIAADGSTPDLVAGVDFTGFEAFGTQGTNDYAFAGDSSYGNVVAVTPGVGYGGGSLGQFGIVGFTPGFAAAYDALLFKVKGLADNTVVVKLEEPFPGLSVAVTVDLAAPPAGVTVTDLGDGWSQVVISIANFGDVSTFSQVVIESVPGSQAEGSAFYVTDVGFNSGGATGGEVPGAVIIAADGSTPDLVAGVDFTGFEAFGTQGTNDYAFAGDSSYGNVVAVTPGVGYGGGSLGQFGIVGFTPGFAAAYDALLFKVKGLADNTVVVKLEEPFPGLSVAVTVDLAAPPAGVTVTDLGDGWSQVVISIANFGDVSTFSQVVIESVPGSQAEGSAFYVTDVGFNSGGATGGEVPGAVIIAADGSTPDLVAGVDFTGFEAFGTQGTNDYAFAGDSSYGNVVAVTPGVGYGGGSLGQFGIVGFTPGFAAAYDALLFKVKGLADNTVVVKLEEPFPGASVAVTVDLAAPPAGVTVTDLGDGWSQVVISIANFGDVSTFSQVVIESVPGSQAEGSAFYVTDVGFNSGGATGGELAVNGDFETGDLTGWTDFPNEGVVQISSPGEGGSGFAGNLDASGVATGATIKQANVGAGTLTPGQTVTVTFDWKGTDASGGVVDGKLFSEVDGGGVSDTAQILSGAGFPADWTTVGPLDITIGTDVTGGITLEITAICGADAGCVSNIFIDNVSITVP